jgi:hypothetical protein
MVTTISTRLIISTSVVAPMILALAAVALQNGHSYPGLSVFCLGCFLLFGGMTEIARINFAAMAEMERQRQQFNDFSSVFGQLEAGRPSPELDLTRRVSGQLGSLSGLDDAALSGLRRRYAKANHPDVVPAADRADAGQRIGIANDLIDQAKGRLRAGR